MPNNSCKDCPDRTPYCHGECERFKEFLKENEERKKKIKHAEAKYRDQYWGK